jgi:hypothetical protein
MSGFDTIARLWLDDNRTQVRDHLAKRGVLRAAETARSEDELVQPMRAASLKKTPCADSTAASRAAATGRPA